MLLLSFLEGGCLWLAMHLKLTHWGDCFSMQHEQTCGWQTLSPYVCLGGHDHIVRAALASVLTVVVWWRTSSTYVTPPPDLHMHPYTSHFNCAYSRDAYSIGANHTATPCTRGPTCLTQTPRTPVQYLCRERNDANIQSVQDDRCHARIVSYDVDTPRIVRGGRLRSHRGVRRPAPRGVLVFVQDCTVRHLAVSSPRLHRSGVP